MKSSRNAAREAREAQTNILQRKIKENALALTEHNWFIMQITIIKIINKEQLMFVSFYMNSVNLQS